MLPILMAGTVPCNMTFHSGSCC